MGGGRDSWLTAHSTDRTPAGSSTRRANTQLTPLLASKSFRSLPLEFLAIFFQIFFFFFGQTSQTFVIEPRTEKTLPTSPPTPTEPPFYSHSCHFLTRILVQTATSWKQSSLPRFLFSLESAKRRAAHSRHLLVGCNNCTLDSNAWFYIFDSLPDGMNEPGASKYFANRLGFEIY